MMEFKWVTGEEARKIDPQKILWPADSHVLFVMDGDEIIARSSITNVPMIEGTDIREDRRNGTLGARIIKEVERKYLEVGEPTALAFAPTGEVADYLIRLGYQVQPLVMLMKPLIKREAA